MLPALIAGYLLGSIPFGLILTRLTGAGDLRKIGSGSIGATNVLRTGRKGLAAATLLLDAGKGIVSVLLASWWSGGDAEVIIAAACAAMVGHCFPIWLRFNGGKGVATLLGIDLALDWRILLACALVWLIIARLTKISSLGGMSSAVAAPAAAFALYLFERTGTYTFWVKPTLLVDAIGLAIMAVLVVFQHRANVIRLRAGTESRIGGGQAA